MKLNKLALFVASAMAVTACGGGSGSSDNGSNPAPQATTVSQSVTVDRYSDPNVEAQAQQVLGDTASAQVASEDEQTLVCLDTNNNGSCSDETTTKVLDSGVGSTTLEWSSNIDTSNLNIVAQNKKFVYKVKASEGGNAQTRTPLFVNPLTDAATRLGKEKFAQAVGYTGDVNTFSATKDYSGLDESVQVLSDSVASIAASDTTGVYDEETVLDKLGSIFTKIVDQLQNAKISKVQIVINIILNQDVDPADPDKKNNVPVASFEYIVGQNGVVTFTNKSTDADGDKLVYNWTFGDGASSKDVAPTHTYNTNNTYKVTLVVSDGKDTDVLRKEVTVDTVTIEKPFEPAFNYTTDGLTVKITNTTKDVDDNTQYRWDFGDGSELSTEKNPTHSYAQNGTYTIKMQAMSSTGAKKVVTKENVKVSGGEGPIDVVTLSVSDISASTNNLSASFVANVNYNGKASISYVWNFGDGKTLETSSNKATHTYANEGTYSVSVVAKDANGVTGSKSISGVNVKKNVVPPVDVCPTDNPFCKGDIDPAECVQTCEEKEIEVCPETATAQTAADSSSLTAIETQYYKTNPNGQVGKNKTITGPSDWTTDMIVAQGAANDDPRAYRGYHEKATDFYAMYAAWDDTNLYLMVEMPNIEGKENGGDFDYSNDQFLPMGIGIRTGKRPAGNGLMVDGNNVWTAGKFYTIEEGIDTLLMFHPRLPTVNKPGLFKTNSEGLFSYETEDGSLLGFDEAKIERVNTPGTKSANYWGISDNYGGAKDNYLTGSYEDLLAKNANASGHLYQITIPLASIDITKDYLETNGIAVVAFSTFGESMMDALPWTPNLVDVASEAYSKDDSTSQEKEDFDLYDVPLARVGKFNGVIPTPTPTPTPTPCTTKKITVCTPETLPATCQSSGSIDVKLSHSEQESADKVTTNVNVATGYKGVTYTWEVTGSKAVTSSYDKTSKSFSIPKKNKAQNVTVKVTAKNASGTKIGSESFSFDVPACEDCGINPPVDSWVENQGIDSDNIKTYDPNNTCKAQDGAIVLKADAESAPNLYAYGNDASEVALTAKWPGDSLTKIDGCTSTFYQSKANLLPNSGAKAIFNGVNGDRYPADMQPGVEMTAAKACFDWESKKALPLEECGLGASAPKDTAYILKNGSEVQDGSTIVISYNEEVPTTAYVDVSLMVYGEKTDASTLGTYTINDKSGQFTNGQIIRVGQNIPAAEDKASAEPMVLTVSYGDVTKTFKFIKVKYQKPQAVTQFSWNNALMYFVMTDRFYNGDKSNDNSYGRPYKDATGHATATYHGGDIKGMTERLDYIKSLGMNAIWITAPYEQSHGWTGGGSSGAFAHYAYHGYYALDFTSLDKNVGTVDEFRTFVTEAHKRGIRVVLDIVMNHSGYATLQDMCDYGFGVRSDGKSACDPWQPGSGETWHNKPISEESNAAWNGWWGKDWIKFGGYGEQCGAGDGLDACVSFLPDFKNSQTHGSSVSVPKFLQTKWSKADAEHDIPAAKAYRSGNMSVAEFEAHWLASWVEEFGIDGFRCDTAKHVTKSTWKLLKDLSNEALAKWRANNAGDDPAASWTDKFWMTGEHWGYKTDPTDGGAYASQGGFDSMINFSFNGQSNGSCSAPTVSSWDSYASMYGVGSGSPKLNALTYISSHDTSLCRPGNMKDLGTAFLLLPGGVQVYYGDETARKNDNGGSGNDPEHGTRSDMNFPSDISSQATWAANVDTLSTSFSSDATLAHWQKIGQFRYRNAAVGAGKQTKTSDGSYCRTYNDEESGINNSVVIHVGSASSVDVGSCFADGTELQDAYSGKTATVSGGKVTLSGAGDLILLELKR